MERKFGFPKHLRLLGRRQYRYVYESGRRGSSRLFLVFRSPNHLPHARFGITVSRKLGQAVERNRLKRLLREILRLHRQDISPGWDIVVNPRPGAQAAAFRKLEEELLRLLPQQNGEQE